MATQNSGGDGCVTSSPTATECAPSPCSSAAGLNPPADLLRPSQAARLVRVHPNTIRNLIERGELDAYHLPSGHRRVQRSQVLEAFGYAQAPHGLSDESRVVGYARISSRGPTKMVVSDSGEKIVSQLNNQINDLKKYAREKLKIKNLTVYKDIASGVSLSEKTRPNFARIVKLITTGEVDKVLVTHSDRLCRLAFDLIQYLCRIHNVELVETNRDPQLDEDEQAQDMKLMLDFIFSWTIKTYSRRNRERLRVHLKEETIRRIKELENEYGPQSIANILNEEGHRNSKNNKLNCYVINKHLRPKYVVQRAKDLDEHIEGFIRQEMEFRYDFMTAQQLYEQYKAFAAKQGLESATLFKFSTILKKTAGFKAVVRAPRDNPQGIRKRGYIRVGN